VTWYTNGQPRTSVVLDGEENIEWLGSTPPSIEIQSCEVCVDRSNPYDRDTAFSGSATQATLVAIPPPEYPAEYRRIGLEGRVVVAFQVDVMGRARNVRVVDSPGGDPNGFWLASVSSALQAANFVPARRNGKAVDSEKQMAFRFKLEDAPPPSPPQ
jgi:TonB family protein